MGEWPSIPKDGGRDFPGKIVIVGAGACGLMAANALKHMGVEDYIVLEASDRIGGRLKKTDDEFEFPLDLGAEWIHHQNAQILQDMLVFDAAGDPGLQPAEFIKYAPMLTFNKRPQRCISKYLYQETKFKRSTWWDWLDKYVYQHVSDKVKFRCPVREIDYSTGDTVRIATDGVGETPGEMYFATKVICTIPLAALKRKDLVTFSPPLPDKKLRAIEAAEMPPGFRIFFEMNEKFYPDMSSKTSLWAQAMDLGNICIMYDAFLGKDAQKNVLGFVAIGPKSAGNLLAKARGATSEGDITTNKVDEQLLIKVVLAEIDEYFDGQGSKNYVKHVVQDWSSEPYICGSYSYPRSKTVMRDLRETVAKKVLFAGEHTARAKWQSMVTGAAMEGRRAAVEAVTGRIN